MTTELQKAASIFGKAGGRSRSKKKIKAVRLNLRKARRARMDKIGEPGWIRNDMENRTLERTYHVLNTTVKSLGDYKYYFSAIQQKDQADREKLDDITRELIKIEEMVKSMHDAIAIGMDSIKAEDGVPFHSA